MDYGVRGHNDENNDETGNLKPEVNKNSEQVF
jgi:hypothetical protein